MKMILIRNNGVADEWVISEVLMKRVFQGRRSKVETFPTTRRKDLITLSKLD